MNKSFLAYFDPKKYTFKAKFYSFLNFKIIKVLMWTLQCTKTLNCAFVLPMKIKVENTLKHFQYCRLAQNQPKFFNLFHMFYSSHFFYFWLLLATKLQKYYVILVYILKSKMGTTEKTGNENTKRRKYGMNKTLKIAR